MREFFYPASIAIVGASRNSLKVGNRILNNLIESNYQGKIYPINPNAEDILGVKAYPTIGDVPGDIDLVMMALPAEQVEGALDLCKKKNIKGAVVVSGGFSEIGNNDLELALCEKSKTCRFRVIGPNTLGIINTRNSMNSSFAYGMPPTGDISFVSQSGAMVEALIMWMKAQGVGIGKIVGTGNKMDVDDGDLLEYLGQDPDTRAIAMYIESIKDGKKFMEASGIVSKTKPIVVLKGGKTRGAVRAAGSHTGAITSSYSLYRGAFRQCGIIEANNITELFDISTALIHQKASRGKKVGIVTNGGGFGVVFTDLAESFGAEIPLLSENVMEELRQFLPNMSSPRNPVDVLGEGDSERYKRVIQVLGKADLDIIAALHVETTLVEPIDVAHGILEASRELDQPLVTAWIGGERIIEPMKLLMGEGIPSFPSLLRGANAIKGLIERGEIIYG